MYLGKRRRFVKTCSEGAWVEQSLISRPRHGALGKFVKSDDTCQTAEGGFMISVGTQTEEKNPTGIFGYRDGSRGRPRRPRGWPGRPRVPANPGPSGSGPNTSGLGAAGNPVALGRRPAELWVMLKVTAESPSAPLTVPLPGMRVDERCASPARRVRKSFFRRRARGTGCNLG